MRRTHESLAEDELRRERWLTHALLAVSGVGSLLLANDLLSALLAHLQAVDVGRAAEQVAFLGIVAILLYGTFVYGVTRAGYLRRREAHRPASSGELDETYGQTNEPLTLLVPSYREEPEVVRQTLLSAALQDHPHRRVVLLIDDPPDASGVEQQRALERTRRLPGEVHDLLEKPAARFAQALADHLARAGEGTSDPWDEVRGLQELHAEAAAWFETQENATGSSHVDLLFREVTFSRRAREHRRCAQLLEESLGRGQALDAATLAQQYHRLSRLFTVEISAFERKRYQNLSHEPNKAMNLNAYIGLLGRSLREIDRQDGLHLEPALPGAADLVVPGCEFVITLDADSLLAPDYALRLVHFMRRPGHERVAVVQTPYSAVPAAPGLLERLAGATTDMQYVIHQGFTAHGATFWVGANALLRTEALRDIGTVRRERGHDVDVFVQDHTVIEDTESSIDLICRGWTLHNYPDRLSYSATPPDFGALLVQRRRWANGGLLILPKLLRQLRAGRAHSPRAVEAWLRCHYLTSTAAVNFALLCLLVWPFEHALRTLWLPVAALPYFALYARDLFLAGYSRAEVVRVYALNLLLLPVNLGGVAKSLGQGLTGRKTPFARTPKVPGRTPAPPFYLLAELGLVALLCAVFALDLARGHLVHASFVLANAGLLAWALIRLVGRRSLVLDLRLARPARLARARPV